MSLEEVDALSLDEWLGYLRLPHQERPELLPSYEFLSDRHFDEYIATLNQRTDRDVKMLLRNFLLEGGNLGVDSERLSFYTQQPNFADIVLDNEYVRRLLHPTAHAWEGMTWILDLLPDHPTSAIAAIEAYDLAHYFILPDGRARGLYDAVAVIRAKYLDAVSAERLVDSLTSREFEFLVAALFLQDGFEVRVTRATRDGGYDLLATRASKLSTERILVECKCQRAPVGVVVARALVGVVDASNATRGILATSGSFTASTVRYARDSGRLALIDHAELCKRLNAHFGPHWIRRASEISAEAREHLGPDSGEASIRATAGPAAKIEGH